MRNTFGTLRVMNLTSNVAFIFDMFPAAIETSSRANWEPQNTTTGTKPLFYANRDPRRLTFDELWLDNTESGESLAPQIQELFALLEETDYGTPPPLLVMWGDRRERCVLEELTVREEFFDRDGTPLRARVSMSLTQLQQTEEQPPVRRNEQSHFTF